jgi:hypothetical protein
MKLTIAAAALLAASATAFAPAFVPTKAVSTQTALPMS